MIPQPLAQGFGWRIDGQGYTTPGKVSVEGDWSNAAPWLCMGALAGTGVTVTGLDPHSLQGDKEVCDILRQMGADITNPQDGGDYTSLHRALTPTVIDARNIPDLVPVLAAVAACTPGETRVIGAERLRLKESDRLQTTAQTLNALGGDVTETPDGLIIRGKASLDGGTVDAVGDHRIAMAAAVASVACQGPVTVTGAQAVDKSYPTFWQEVAHLGKNVSQRA
jgi:3-phosphoshikimate 1-carboxyvinyltransferase